MEASQHNELQIIQSYVNNKTIEDSPSKTVKMEDVTSSSTSSQSLLEIPTAGSAPKSADSKPVKKRKSWGQVLPEPKTNLAPRKVIDFTTRQCPVVRLFTMLTDVCSAPRQQTRRNSDG
jgi:hypothetical protein